MGWWFFHVLIPAALVVTWVACFILNCLRRRGMRFLILELLMRQEKTSGQRLWRALKMRGHYPSTFAFRETMRRLEIAALIFRRGPTSDDRGAGSWCPEKGVLYTITDAGRIWWCEYEERFYPPEELLKEVVRDD